LHPTIRVSGELHQLTRCEIGGIGFGGPDADHRVDLESRLELGGDQRLGRRSVVEAGIRDRSAFPRTPPP
jgi:hypothetical protein